MRPYAIKVAPSKQSGAHLSHYQGCSGEDATTQAIEAPTVALGEERPQRRMNYTSLKIAGRGSWLFRFRRLRRSSIPATSGDLFPEEASDLTSSSIVRIRSQRVYGGHRGLTGGV